MDGGFTVYTKQAATESPNVDFLCGWCTGCIETCILFPLSKMTFRQQLHGVLLKDAVAQIFTEGISHLYRGLLPPLIQRTSTRMVMFGMFDTYKRILGCPDRPFTWCYAFAAILAGSTEAMLCPLERVQVLLQTSAHHSKFRNTSEAFRYVRGYGVSEFYRGFSLVVTRNSLSNALFFTIRDPLKDVIIASLQTLSTSAKLSEGGASTSKRADPEEVYICESDAFPAIRSTSPPVKSVDKCVPVSPFIVHVSNFVSGALLGAGISTLFFPLNVVKHRMQSIIGSEFVTARKVFQMVWTERNRSIRELYRGVHLNYTRSLLTWGITNSVYEYLKNFLRTM